MGHDEIWTTKELTAYVIVFFALGMAIMFTCTMNKFDRGLATAFCEQNNMTLKDGYNQCVKIVNECKQVKDIELINERYAFVCDEKC